MASKFSKMILAFAVVTVAMMIGCSEKKDVNETQSAEIQLTTPPAATPHKKKRIIPLDSSRIVTYKDYDPNDSIMVGVRAFIRAEKEFIKKWEYAKDTELFIDVVSEICRNFRSCASRLDTTAYKNDVTFILDSLMQNGLLDSAIEARKQEMNGPCFGNNYEKNFSFCNEKTNEEIRIKVREEMKKKKVLLGGPEPRTHGCLDGCRGLPCEEKARCAQRNCPNGKFKCELKNLGTTDKDKKMDSLIEERVRDAMAKEPFKAMVEEQKKFNDSLDLRKDRNTPHKPGPEGVLRKLIRDCIEKGTCTDE
ncbi:hypothetical protein SAMN05720766_11013 [Fibrobacter sp. UWH9]|uniref:hypothetical protein n=1 Tax=Fibrobacter sp. UWH9 TaxID=1896213 RepID=UPI00091F85D6|nr:hypothetical protein [Fibrobacter sp. UWH9]SHH30977.1 hypothetical protein SAMN05720766_11013 [Fibrobacter sp. UWH9]